MSRLPRFGDYRYIGARPDMVFYDCDDEEQFEELKARMEEAGLVARNQVQTFSPDEPFEARNRGFRPA